MRYTVTSVKLEAVPQKRNRSRGLIDQALAAHKRGDALMVSFASVAERNAAYQSMHNFIVRGAVPMQTRRRGLQLYILPADGENAR